MKIFLVTSHFAGQISSFLKPLGEVEILPKNYRTIKDFSVDLLVYAGGEDINPQVYGSRPQYSFYNDERDSWELSLFNAVKSGRLHVKKTFGICRGLQLLNVALGGSLHLDILDSYGKSHKGSHDLKHRIPNIFDFLIKVNSMHHQCARSIGKGGQIISVEPESDSPEMIIWNNNYLGVQFHPEFFNPDSESRIQFVQVLGDWVENNTSIIRTPVSVPKNVEEPRKKITDSNIGYLVNQSHLELINPNSIDEDNSF
jgi:putative glutamine amidotransferase